MILLVTCYQLATNLLIFCIFVFKKIRSWSEVLVNLFLDLFIMKKSETDVVVVILVELELSCFQNRFLQTKGEDILCFRGITELCCIL